MKRPAALDTEGAAKEEVAHDEEADVLEVVEPLVLERELNRLVRCVSGMNAKYSANAKSGWVTRRIDRAVEERAQSPATGGVGEVQRARRGRRAERPP